MQIVIDIPPKWFDDMVKEEFIDMVCSSIQAVAEIECIALKVIL